VSVSVRRWSESDSVVLGDSSVTVPELRVPFFLLRDAYNSFLFSFYMANRETHKPLVLSALLGSKDEVAMI
jgi:hypothetical protein